MTETAQTKLSSEASLKVNPAARMNGEADLVRVVADDLHRDAGCIGDALAGHRRCRRRRARRTGRRGGDPVAREHNDANVLALGARMIGPEVARDCLLAFLETGFAGGRHAHRVAKLSAPMSERAL
jgi:hypothetical protein